MIGEADRLAFDTASKPAASNSAEFAQIAKMAASLDTLDGFVREMKTRVRDLPQLCTRLLRAAVDGVKRVSFTN